MMDRIKYVVIENTFSGEEIFLFSPCINHREFANRIGGQVVSAGFVGHSSKTRCGLYPYGESVSLKLSSRPTEDQRLLDSMFKKEY